MYDKKLDHHIDFCNNSADHIEQNNKTNKNMKKCQKSVYVDDLGAYTYKPHHTDQAKHQHF